MRSLNELSFRTFGCVLACIVSLASTSCGKGSSIPGMKNFSVSVNQGRLNIGFLSTSLRWDVGGTVPIPQLGDAQISIQPDLQSDGVIFGFSASIDSILENGLNFDRSPLPDGRAIPGVNGGVMHRTDAGLGNNYFVSVYFSDEAFGFYIPLPINKKELIKYLFKPLVFTIKDSKGNRIGKGYLMPPTSTDGTGAGLMILLPHLGAGPRA